MNADGKDDGLVDQYGYPLPDAKTRADEAHKAELRARARARPKTVHAPKQELKPVEPLIWACWLVGLAGLMGFCVTSLETDTSGLDPRNAGSRTTQQTPSTEGVTEQEYSLSFRQAREAMGGLDYTKAATYEDCIVYAGCEYGARECVTMAQQAKTDKEKLDKIRICSEWAYACGKPCDARFGR